MFIGAINSDVRKFLASLTPVLKDKKIIVGCSGNFTSEAVLTQVVQPKGIFSNDVSLYSGCAGAYLTDQEFRLQIKDEGFEWLAPYLKSTADKLSVVMILLDMLQFEKLDNIHRKRMWQNYLANFDTLFEKTNARISVARIKIDGYYAGDVYDHFCQNDHSDSVFMCYAPTYAGGYERMYKRLGQIFEWDEPSYTMLDDAARDRLLDWMRKRQYVWYDDRIIPGLDPIMVQKSGRARAVYIYSNITEKPVYLRDKLLTGLPKLRLANLHTEITANSTVKLVPIKTSDLARFKNAFLGKNILFGQGTWAFAVMVDDQTVGFIEFAKEKFGHSGLYINSDFAIPGTRYKRLSKLVVSLAVSGETRKMMERINMLRLKSLSTTAFTERPVSMKYRGVLNLVKRGVAPDGKHYLNYEGEFNQLTWKEVLHEWLTKHGSTTS
ncbi:hypothetical protein ADN00_15770 [Ornatilinea apprima]|uniref:Uncharacterized protein n=1 Tax=Ornatilinea apprima TaxID=1134406 RepID=A0A0P6WZL1_9CHLR|nr:hypothetical protein [Ornatilinea apprima]KPL72272.1 hypothetical protein ADN00_15770 [Ornatilinea apprima]